MTLSTDHQAAAAPKSMFILPNVLEKMPDGSTRAFDVYSRLAQDRIIMLTGEVNPESCTNVVAQFMFLENAKSTRKDSSSDIHFFIASPGGHVDDGMGIYDAMQFVKSRGIRVHTYAQGLAMSMGSVLLVAGSKGCRNAMANARIMLHEPSGGASGKTREVTRTAQEMAHMKTRFAMLFAAHTNLSFKETTAIMNDPDYFIRAEDALKDGIVDNILYPTLDREIAAKRNPNMSEEELDALEQEMAIVADFNKQANLMHQALRAPQPVEDWAPLNERAANTNKKPRKKAAAAQP